MNLLSEFKRVKKSLPKGVNLLAVSKRQSAASVLALNEQGQLEFGESRLQEALPKIENLRGIKDLSWHFIGQLQKNKVRGVVRTFDFIHSIDSLSLAERISRIAGEENKCPKSFIQVKLRGDINKKGFSYEELLEAWPTLRNLSNIHLIGLMLIPPLLLDLSQRKKLFVECRSLANKLELKDCSMGMSDDWEVAVEAGATWIRLGSLLFGKRDK